MTVEVNPTLIESLSAQSIASCHWLKRVQFAAKVLFGASSIALVARCAKEQYQLAGLVSEDGILTCAPPDNLEHFGVGPALQSIDHFEYRQHFFAADEITEIPPQRDNALFIPWYLGIDPKFALIIFGLSVQASLPSKTLVDAFLTIANNLLRRATKRRLMDAGAWIEAEINKLAKLQNLLQPADLSSLSGVSFAAYSQPHAYAGGDYYDVAQIDLNNDGHCDKCLITLADVSGHGPAAVVETAMIDSILRTYADTHPGSGVRGPAHAMAYLNRHMFTRQPRPTFATMFAAEWHAASFELTYCLAGHPPPILKKAETGECFTIEPGDGIPLQILRDFQWTKLTMSLASGDILVAYSDGVTEALSPAGVQFGIERLTNLVANGPNDPVLLLDEIKLALNRHVEDRPFHDDQTIVIAKFD